jgi:putative transposase
MLSPKEHANFITITCLEWRYILVEDSFKEIIISSLKFLSDSKRVNIFAFCIMSNHLHMIWQMIGDHRKEDVQRDFLKYTGQRILKVMRNSKSPLLDKLYVGAKDRKYQVWERNALSIPLYSDKAFFQKLNYIHNNPVVAGLCDSAEDYKFSSALFYSRGVRNFDFLRHYEG